MTLTRLLPAALAALVLAACASEPPRSLPQATAVPETVRVEMPVDGRDNGLTWDQIELISALAGEYKARGHGPLVISYPRDAGNADAAIEAIAAARTRFYDAGLSWRQISGGAYNAALMRRLGQLLQPAAVQSTAALGVEPAWVEAVAFAWLAKRCLDGAPGNLPAVTGAESEVILGAIYQA